MLQKGDKIKWNHLTLTFKERWKPYEECNNKKIKRNENSNFFINKTHFIFNYKATYFDEKIIEREKQITLKELINNPDIQFI